MNAISFLKKNKKNYHEVEDINRILNKAIESLSVNDKDLVKILSYAIMKPSYLCIDGLLGYLDNRTKILLLNYLNTKEILLINVTSDMDDALYTDYTLCLYDGISAIDGKTLDVLKWLIFNDCSDLHWLNIKDISFTLAVFQPDISGNTVKDEHL